MYINSIPSLEKNHDLAKMQTFFQVPIEYLFLMYIKII